MEKLKAKLAELKELGFTKEQVLELMEIGEKEILDKILDEFGEKAEDDMLEKYTQKIEQNKDNREELTKILNEIIINLYGQENIEEKKEQFLIEYIQSIIDLTKETKDVYEKYAAGDPETVKAIEEAKNDPNVHEIAKLMEEDK